LPLATRSTARICAARLELERMSPSPCERRD
jgi:hypothetical protein